jgi:hypothetical protein
MLTVIEQGLLRSSIILFPFVLFNVCLIVPHILCYFAVLLLMSLLTGMSHDSHSLLSDFIKLFVITLASILETPVPSFDCRKLIIFFLLLLFKICQFFYENLNVCMHAFEVELNCKKASLYVSKSLLDRGCRGECDPFHVQYTLNLHCFC